jgi:hypothetical protein
MMEVAEPLTGKNTLRPLAAAHGYTCSSEVAKTSTSRSLVQCCRRMRWQKCFSDRMFTIVNAIVVGDVGALVKPNQSADPRSKSNLEARGLRNSKTAILSRDGRLAKVCLNSEELLTCGGVSLSSVTSSSLETTDSIEKPRFK